MTKLGEFKSITVQDESLIKRKLKLKDQRA
jgi:hypothetical protein